MAGPKKPLDDKTESLKKYGALNPHPHKVAEKTFSDSALEFFDPRDLVQVKYEMLRAVEKEGRSVKHSSEAFGFSRPAFYQVQSQFKQGGVTGLVKKRPGPKSAHKLTDDIMAFIEEKVKDGKPLRARKLAPLIREKFGKDVHPRTIERAVTRRKKKEKMTVRKSQLVQYESLRLQVLNRYGDFSERGLGLALFIRQGMLAWIELCHRCIPPNSNRQKRAKIPVLAHETTSEMIKVMANITLFNLEEALV